MSQKLFYRIPLILGLVMIFIALWAYPKYMIVTAGLACGAYAALAIGCGSYFMQRIDAKKLEAEHEETRRSIKRGAQRTSGKIV